jgi:hypothetical protein
LTSSELFAAGLLMEFLYAKVALYSPLKVMLLAVFGMCAMDSCSSPRLVERERLEPAGPFPPRIGASVRSLPFDVTVLA